MLLAELAATGRRLQRRPGIGTRQLMGCFRGGSRAASSASSISGLLPFLHAQNAAEQTAIPARCTPSACRAVS